MTERLSILLALIVLMPSLSWAATYYVDASTSCANCDGTTHTYTSGTTGPFKTITQVNDKGFTAGDDVYFKMGQTWSGTQFVIDWSGVNEANRSIIGAYCGSGTIYDGTNCSGESKPIIRGNSSALTGGTEVPRNSTWAGLVHGTDRQYVTVQYLQVDYSGGSGIKFDKGSRNTITGCIVDAVWYGATSFANCSTYGTSTYNTVSRTSSRRNPSLGGSSSSSYDAAIGFVGLAQTCGSDNGYAAHNTITESRGEGLGFYRGTSGCLGEFNTIYNSQSTNLYVGTSRNNVMRYNFVHSSYPGAPTSSSLGMADADETYNGYAWSAGNQFYGNIIYGAATCFTYANYHADSVGSTKVYNNTCVDTKNGINQYGSGPYAAGAEVKNNIIACTGERTGCVMSSTGFPDPHTNLTFDFNSWSTLPQTALRGNNDTTGIPTFTRTSGWATAAKGALTRADFVLQSSDTKAKDTGATLGASYVLDSLGVTRPSGPAWDIGALELNQGDGPDPPPPPPTGNITFWSDLENDTAYFSGGDSSWTLQNGEFNTSANKVGTDGLDLTANSSYARISLSGTDIANKALGSMAVWVRFPSSIPTGGFWKIMDAGNSHKLYMIVASGDVSITNFDGTNYDTATADSNIVANTWYAVVGRWDDTNNKLKVEVYSASGALIAQKEETTSWVPGSNAFTLMQLGPNSSGNYYYDQFIAIADTYEYDWASIITRNAPPLDLSCGINNLESWETCGYCKELGVTETGCVDDETAAPGVVITSPASGGTYQEITGLYLSVTQAANCRFGTGDDNEYAEMDAGDVLTRSGLTHTKSLSLADGEYTYHVACLNAYGEGRASTTFTQETPSDIEAGITAPGFPHAIALGESITFQYNNTVPSCTDGLSCAWDWDANDETDLTDAGCDNTDISWTPATAGLKSVKLTVSCTTPSGSDSDTLSDFARVLVGSTSGVFKVSASGGDYTGAITDCGGTGPKDEDIIQLSDANLDLSGCADGTLDSAWLTGTTSGTRTITPSGQRVLSWPVFGGRVIISGPVAEGSAILKWGVD